ncbi:MAG: cbb3-type cytochrome c oxidase subunit I, partial [Phycisphaerae bacterium]|nr:cbb3-type cytochrome c oxidase subunit I [Phycisphaerae bacterium]
MATKRYVPAIGPKLQWVLRIVLGLFAVLCVNSVYLAAVTLLQSRAASGAYGGGDYENNFYQWMFFIHLVLGLAIVVPVVVFGCIHIANARNRPNKRAIRAGYATFATALGVLVTGVALTRVDIGALTINLKDPASRSVVYWLHVILPLAAAWLFVLHRLAGRRIKWKTGARWALVAAVFAGGMVLFHLWNPRVAREGPRNPDYWEPSLARTATGRFIPASILDNSDECLECHADIHHQWSHSVHAFSSFNNPLYTFSVRKTREHAFAHDGHVQDARFCAGCHDPVPFFSGAFELAKWDDPNYDVASDPLGKASITCTVCHSITSINGVRGNADYTISEPERYPFEGSTNPVLKWVSQQLIKAKPAFHKRTFLKPEVHRSAEFCSTCHKVFLPEELNDYKWLRGQNHYDSWRLSGVSGRGVAAWYYPPAPQTSCNACHMPTVASNDFGAKVRDESGVLTVRNHMFPSANTAIPVLAPMTDPQAVIRAHEQFNQGVMRLDLMALREGGTLEGTLHAPLRPSVPALVPGESYMLDAVVRTVKMGHEFTQGTADSNEIWLDVTLLAGGRVIGRSGGMDEGGGLDPWSRFYNIFLLDREGRRIDR